MITKLATTVYGLVGWDYIRITLARVDGAVAWVRADGSDAVLPTMPIAFRTSGDIANVMPKLGHNVNAAAVPSVGLPNHEWKTAYTLAELAEHKYQGPALKANMAALVLYYSDDVEVAA